MEGEEKRRGGEGREEVRERERVNESINVNMNMEESQAATVTGQKREKARHVLWLSFFCFLCS